jgi:hypothetical protein
MSSKNLYNDFSDVYKIFYKNTLQNFLQSFYQLSVTGYQLSVINSYLLLVINCYLSTRNVLQIRET